MFGQKEIVSSLFADWAAAFGGVTTVYPGMQIETTDLSRWVELRVDAWSRPAQRAGVRRRIEFTVTAHGFVRNPVDKGAVHDLAENLRRTLENRHVEVKDFAAIGHPVVGHLRLTESTVREVTRQELNVGRPGVEHVVVTCGGWGEEA